MNFLWYCICMEYCEHSQVKQLSVFICPVWRRSKTDLRVLQIGGKLSLAAFILSAQSVFIFNFIFPKNVFRAFLCIFSLSNSKSSNNKIILNGISTRT